MRISFFIFLMVLSTTSISQIKHEKEYAVKFDKVPNSSVDFINSLSLGKKVKWYKELSQQGISYEAKFTLKKKKYSIEFDSLGYIQDIEVLIKEKQMDTAITNIIKATFKKDLKNHKVLKIQRKYTGDELELKRVVMDKTSQTVEEKFEIVVCGIKEGQFETYEYLFSAVGKKEVVLKIIESTNDNLDF